MGRLNQRFFHPPSRAGLNSARPDLRGVMAAIVLAAAAISLGADAPTHWAYRKPIQPSLPSVHDAAWVQNSVDAFVLAKLESANLQPAPRADRRTLIRRAYFDLIGLPPTPAQVDAFEHDDSTDAFAKVVDSLLASPHYGERWGRYWLDVARYADTKGYVFEEERRYPYAYTYRDYVIRSFNEDKQYDRFLIEQIAADLLPLGDDKRPLAAMGFLTLGRRFLNHIPDIIDDRMDVVCRGTLGVTIGCARCHNHKFDPIPTKDYYSLYSIFNNSPDAKDLPLIGEAEHTPEYDAFLRQIQDEQGKIDQYIAQQHDAIVPTFRTAKSISDHLMATQNPGAIDDRAFASGLGVNRFMVQRWMAYLKQAADQNDPVFQAWRQYAAIPAGEFAVKAPAVTQSLADGRGRLVDPLVALALAARPPASLKDVADRYGSLLAAVDRVEPFAAAIDPSLWRVMHGEGAPTEVALADVERLFKRDSRDHLRKLRNEIEAIKATNPAAPPRAMALTDSKTIEPQQVFVRGNEGNRGDAVQPHFLSCLSEGEPTPFTHGSGRLEFAQAIASKDNPLTARVMVNRVWLHHFGYGIVRTPSDFGTRGDPPTHPELLDYLAVDFMQHGWSIKHLQRQIMLSSTYQEASDLTEAADRADPQNLLLSHFNRQRLDFEASRDAILCVSGQLDSTVYGHSVDVNAEPFTSRRSVYAFIDRQNLPGTFRSFDFASPDTTCARRFTTTVPQQALFMMNSPFEIAQVRALLRRPDIAPEKDDRQRISDLYRLLFGRLPSSDEMALGVAYVAGEQASHAEKRESGLSPWEKYVQVLLESNEFVFVD